MSLAQLGAGPIERLRAGERIEVVPYLSETGDHFGDEFGAERDHHVVRGDVLPGHARAPGLRVNPFDLAGDEVDAGLFQTRDRA